MTREDVTFLSGDDRIAAWLYAGGSTCVVMAHGFSLTRHDGLEPYAEALNMAGATVLVFDHRYLGDSGGEPRQRVRVKQQQEDYRAAITYARQLDGVERVVLWGYSFAGGTSVNVAARDPDIAGLMLLCPFLDGTARVLGTTRRTPLVGLRIMARAVRDRLGSHNLIKVTAEPGSLAAMAFEGESDGFAAATTGSSPWRNEVSPGAFATIAFHRPVDKAKRLKVPVWVGLGDRDITVSRRAIETFAVKAPQVDLHRYDLGHFEPFHGDDPAVIAADQAEWFSRTF